MLSLVQLLPLSRQINKTFAKIKWKKIKQNKISILGGYHLSQHVYKCNFSKISIMANHQTKFSTANKKMTQIHWRVTRTKLNSLMGWMISPSIFGTMRYGAQFRSSGFQSWYKSVNELFGFIKEQCTIILTFVQLFLFVHVKINLHDHIVTKTIERAVAEQILSK